MITLNSSGYITTRGIRVGLVADVLMDSGIRFGGEYRPIANKDDLFYSTTCSSLDNRRITPPILMQVISNSKHAVLVKFKDHDYIIGKNLIFSYDVKTGAAVPKMLHVVKGTRTLREGRVVINPELFETDVTFYKMFQTILQTGVDVELTRFIEEKYYLSLDLPKFGTPMDRRNYLDAVKAAGVGALQKKKKDEESKAQKQRRPGVAEW